MDGCSKFKPCYTLNFISLGLSSGPFGALALLTEKELPSSTFGSPQWCKKPIKKSGSLVFAGGGLHTWSCIIAGGETQNSK